MQLSNKEQELLSTYQNWLKENKLNDKCNAYFISKTSMLVFQVWDFQKLISETLWLKTDNQEWKFYIKTLGGKFNKSFCLKEILEIEKDFILKAFKEKSSL
ncbi:hypothetical protein [Spiroplasma ixodetis]|uniref:hypothetical protein n=1 Tax=Spiroplasma ixodetis TaxID=2141 RepID=UPI0025785DF1|nr:hypothetical protein [Spiroplasma ixodetis]WJG71484.1 hypothetical protein SIXOD_v1c29380 [Spiroplasma ixodetis Y32]